MARSTADTTQNHQEAVELSSLDDRLLSILDAIEREQVPERLMKLAMDLQAELALRRQRQNPH